MASEKLHIKLFSWHYVCSFPIGLCFCLFHLECPFSVPAQRLCLVNVLFQNLVTGAEILITIYLLSRPETIWCLVDAQIRLSRANLHNYCTVRLSHLNCASIAFTILSGKAQFTMLFVGFYEANNAWFLIGQESVIFKADYSAVLHNNLSWHRMMPWWACFFLTFLVCFVLHWIPQRKAGHDQMCLSHSYLFCSFLFYTEHPKGKPDRYKGGAWMEPQ